MSLAALSTIDEVLARFDRLGPVDVGDMLGEWSGEVLPTGHPGERQLTGLAWAGKTFRSAEDVDPIVVFGAGGAREASDVMGSARLRRVEYRDVVSATMIYDRHPILDHFRRVDADTVLGLMDRKGEDRPLAFILRREPARP